MRYVAIVSRAVVFSRVKFCEPVLGVKMLLVGFG